MNTNIVCSAEDIAKDNLLPRVILIEDSKGITPVGVSSYCFENGIIPITGTIDDDMCMRLQLLMHIAEERRQDLTFIINSPGGMVTAGLGMIDAVKDYPYEVDMYCTGIAASMAAIFLASGRKGHRFISPHSKVMIHEPLMSGGVSGSATTIARTAQSILETKSITNGLLSEYTGRTTEEIDNATAFDTYFNAEEAIEFGLCDKISTGFGM